GRRAVRRGPGRAARGGRRLRRQNLPCVGQARAGRRVGANDGRRRAHVRGSRPRANAADRRPCPAREPGKFYTRAARERSGHAGTPPHASWVSLPGGEDWLLRPVVRGMCRFESLKDGTVDLADVALMNDALDVIAENEQIARDLEKD